MLYYDAKRRVLPSSPNNYYREQMQQLINSQWDNTTMLQTIEEEKPFASFQFHEIEVRMIHALDKSTRAKQGDDFRELIFKDIDYLVSNFESMTHAEIGQVLNRTEQAVRAKCWNHPSVHLQINGWITPSTIIPLPRPPHLTWISEKQGNFMKEIHFENNIHSMIPLIESKM
jgi:hypothetical protein